MSETFWAMLTVFGLGIVYFLVAIPTGVAMHLNPVTAALCAWAGYSAIAGVMLAVGAPARRLADRFKISASPNWRSSLEDLAAVGIARPALAAPSLAVPIWPR
jgi:hypothetical protein